MKLHPKIIELLNNRGIVSEEDIAEFISDKPKRTYDPFLLPDMEEGVDLILSAIENEEKICVYGDYDADGVTSTVILMETLSQLTEELTYYIPSRFGEGYGLNIEAIDKLKREGVSLIVTVDCGSVSVDEVEYAKAAGMKVVVSDHHTVSDRMADCPVINPARKDSRYPFRYLAGCGVAFKLAQAISLTLGLPTKKLTEELDLVALGTIADIVSLTDENRTLVKYGLRVINTSRRESLRTLIEACGLKPGKIRAEDVSFVIAPHINAAGRMRHAGLAVSLLMSRDPAEMQAMAAELVACNSSRKGAQTGIFETCLDLVESEYKDDDFLLLYLEDADEGVTGIVAGKVKERFYKPAVIVTPSGDGLLKGTGRSIDGLNLYDILKKHEYMFTAFGGHAAACGFTMRAQYLDELRQSLCEETSAIRASAPEIFERTVEAELRLGADDLTEEICEQLEILEPCGCDNVRPLAEITGVCQRTARMGSDMQFLRFDANVEGKKRIGCIVFRGADEIEAEIKAAGSAPVRVIGNIGTNDWKGRRYLQLRVEQIRR